MASKRRIGVAETILGLNGDLDAAMTRLENLIRTAVQPFALPPITLIDTFIERKQSHGLQGF